MRGCRLGWVFPAESRRVITGLISSRAFYLSSWAWLFESAFILILQAILECLSLYHLPSEYSYPGYCILSVIEYESEGFIFDLKLSKHSNLLISGFSALFFLLWGNLNDLILKFLRHLNGLIIFIKKAGFETIWRWILCMITLLLWTWWVYWWFLWKRHNFLRLWRSLIYLNWIFSATKVKFRSIVLCTKLELRNNFIWSDCIRRLFLVLLQSQVNPVIECLHFIRNLSHDIMFYGY